MIEIDPIEPGQFDELIELLHESFKTVADEFNITKENSRNNSAFITKEELLEKISKGLIMFGAKVDNELVGCIGIRNAKKEGVFFIEKLGVKPKNRHHGIGKSLLDYSVIEIVNRGGKEISVGIIDDNDVLKRWYFTNGFMEYEIRDVEYLPFTVCLMKLVI
jgi:ribosomal protein S18 acetylase RimI-like enzyme